MSQLPYKTFGYFYKNKHGENCRKYLDIKAEDTKLPHPELIILMLNPGDCGGHKEIALEKDVEIQADPTLYRVEEFMKQRGLNWVRVLSVSDVEEKSSEAFFKKLGLMGKESLLERSLFHPSRREELMRHAKLETPFLLAWGSDKRKEALGNTVVSRIKEQGYRIINEQGPHIHPLSKPAGGLPLWTEYADKVYRDFLNRQNEKGWEEGILSGAQELQQRLTLRDKITSAFKVFNNFERGNPIITSAKEAGRWSLFARLLRDSGSKPYVGTDDYDYVFIDRVQSAAALNDLLLQHNGRKIIIDASSSSQLLEMDGVIDVLESAICISPETTDPKPFVFKGKIALLVAESAEALKSSERFQHLLQDTVVV